MDYHQHISRQPRICGGQPVVTGTRVTLRTLLSTLADGTPESEILAQFPSITSEDLRAVIVFAAASAVEDIPTGSAPPQP